MLLLAREMVAQALLRDLVLQLGVELRIVDGRLKVDVALHVYSRKRYYEYHNGTRPLTPDVERYVRQTIANCGWSQEPQFSGYVEEFLW